jgi:DNA-binding NtrC family response regulator
MLSTAIALLGDFSGDLPHMSEARSSELFFYQEPTQFFREYSSRPFQAAVLRGPLSGVSVSEVLSTCLRLRPEVPVILWLTATTMPEMMQYGRLGAADVVMGKDVALDAVLDSVNAIVTANPAPVRAMIPAGRSKLSTIMIGDSWQMRMIGHLLELVAPRRSTVLIMGETGTGKEVVAKALHAISNRSNAPLVCVNCAALPEDLLEAELFGHVRGAYTGAVNNRIGRVEQANGGTLFLDEVGEIPLNLQAKLLRLLQEKEYQRLGSSETVKAEVRFVVATNADLGGLVKAGKFREDLYYRLRVVPIHLPPLRERPEDIPALAAHFVTKTCRAEGLSPKTFATDVLDEMRKYEWPGNVRQLENAIEMAVALSGERSVLDLGDFPLLVMGADYDYHPVCMPCEGLDFNEAVGRFKRSILTRALQIANGNKSHAALLLSLKRTTFTASLRSLNIAVSDSDDELDENLQISPQVGGEQSLLPMSQGLNRAAAMASNMTHVS